MKTPDVPDTPAKAKARQEYLEACEVLATASAALNKAQAAYTRAFEEYNRAFGAAKYVGVV